MDFKDLRYILAIADCQNMTRAAESLYVGQPTLSKFVAGLEAELGVRLFERVGRRYVLTYAGEHYVRRARQILNLKNDLDTEIADIVEQERGILNIAFANMRCTYMLPCTLPAFAELYPNVEVRLFEGSSTENEARLISGQADVAFFSLAERNPLIEYHTLSKEELLICTRKNHPLGSLATADPSRRYPILELSRLRDYRVLMMQKNQRTRQIVDSILKEKNITLEDTLCTSSMPAIIRLVSMGFGVSILFESHLSHAAEFDMLDCYSIDSDKTICDFVAAVRKGRFLSAYAQAYIELVRQAIMTQ